MNFVDNGTDIELLNMLSNSMSEEDLEKAMKPWSYGKYGSGKKYEMVWVKPTGTKKGYWRKQLVGTATQENAIAFVQNLEEKIGIRNMHTWAREHGIKFKAVFGNVKKTNENCRQAIREYVMANGTDKFEVTELQPIKEEKPAIEEKVVEPISEQEDFYEEEDYEEELYEEDEYDATLFISNLVSYLGKLGYKVESEKDDYGNTNILFMNEQITAVVNRGDNGYSLDIIDGISEKTLHTIIPKDANYIELAATLNQEVDVVLDDREEEDEDYLPNTVAEFSDIANKVGGEISRDYKYIGEGTYDIAIVTENHIFYITPIDEVTEQPKDWNGKYYFRVDDNGYDGKYTPQEIKDAILNMTSPKETPTFSSKVTATIFNSYLKDLDVNVTEGNGIVDYEGGIFVTCNKGVDFDIYPLDDGEHYHMIKYIDSDDVDAFEGTPQELTDMIKKDEEMRTFLQNQFEGMSNAFDEWVSDLFDEDEYDLRISDNYEDDTYVTMPEMNLRTPYADYDIYYRDGVYQDDVSFSVVVNGNDELTFSNIEQVKAYIEQNTTTAIFENFRKDIRKFTDDFESTEFTFTHTSTPLTEKIAVDYEFGNVVNFEITYDIYSDSYTVDTDTVDENSAIVYSKEDVYAYIKSIINDTKGFFYAEGDNGMSGHLPAQLGGLWKSAQNGLNLQDSTFRVASVNLYDGKMGIKVESKDFHNVPTTENYYIEFINDAYTIEREQVEYIAYRDKDNSIQYDTYDYIVDDSMTFDTQEEVEAYLQAHTKGYGMASEVRTTNTFSDLELELQEMGLDAKISNNSQDTISYTGIMLDLGNYHQCFITPSNEDSDDDNWDGTYYVQIVDDKGENVNEKTITTKYAPQAIKSIVKEYAKKNGGKSKTIKKAISTDDQFLDYMERLYENDTYMLDILKSIRG